MIGEWSQTTVVAARLLPGIEPDGRCVLILYVWRLGNNQWFQTGTKAGYFVFHKQLPARVIFKQRRINIRVMFATLSIERHSNWDEFGNIFPQRLTGNERNMFPCETVRKETPVCILLFNSNKHSNAFPKQAPLLSVSCSALIYTVGCFGQ